MKKIHLLTKILLLPLLCGLVLISCETEELLNKEPQQRIEEGIKSSFNKDLFIYNIPTDFSVQWNTGKKVYSDFFESDVTEFETIQTSQSKQTNKLNLYSEYHLIALEKEGKYSFFIVTYTSYNTITKSISLENTKNYTGAILFSGIKNKSMASIWYKKGIQTASNTYRRPELECDSGDCNDDGGGGVTGRWISVRTEHYKDWYKGGNGSSNLTYTHTTYHGSSYETVWDSDASYSYFRSHPYFDPHNTGGNTSTNSGQQGSVISELKTLDKITNRNLPIELKIRDRLTGKAKCVNQLLTNGDNRFITNLLSNFERNNSEFDIKIKSVPKIINPKTGKPIIGALGKTFRESSDSDQIIIHIANDPLENLSKLKTAHTIMHEYIHAEMARRINPDYMTEDDYNFANVWDSYKTKYHSGDHRAMVKFYLDAMAESLESFHKTALTKDFNELGEKLKIHYPNGLTRQFYKRFAWGGLTNTPDFLDLEFTDVNEYSAIVLAIDLEELYGGKKDNEIPCN
ncbi:hypothetical protein [Aquimarina aggregata]|uniref:hypothetical protein n=1 Tax=Aquimarina aggregata TaxID=1642818 RepID=UPI0024907082|nr:hypothetical protein [Aquimarina aggregata]